MELQQNRLRPLFRSILSLLVVSFVTATVLLGSVTPGQAEPETKRVLMLHSFSVRSKPWADYAATIRKEIGLRGSVDFQEHALLSARAAGDSSERPFVEYLHALNADKPPDLIVALGAPAAIFVQRHRRYLFPETPMLITAVERRWLDFDRLTDRDAVVAFERDFLMFYENILHVLPRTTSIAVVIGASPSESIWREATSKIVGPLAERVRFRWYNELSFESVLKDAAALPANSAIFWLGMHVDAAGVTHEGADALHRLSAAANAPIFSFDGSFFGEGIVGGPMQSVDELSKKAAEIALRMLGGENGRDIKPSFVTPALPRFDWRQMQRWQISDSALPLGSKIDFRAPTIWDQYKLHILGAVSLIVVQAMLIGWLFRYAREIAKARDKVRTLNASLEERVKQRTVDLSHARDRAEILLNEVNHRVANSLSIVTSLVKLQTKLVTEQAAKDALAGTEARINAISSIHKQLYTSGDVTSVRLDEYLSGLLHQIATSTQNQPVDAALRYELEPLKLPTNMAVNLGVIVTELVINAFKYAYPFRRGEIRVYLKQLPNRRGELVVEDDGVGRGDEGSAKGTGLGTKLVNSMVRTMDAEIQYLGRQPGTAARLVFPVPG